MPDHADTAAARIRNEHARDTHPSQPRYGWLDATLNTPTTPTDPNGPVMVLRITYRNADGTPDLQSDYYIAVCADDATLYEAQRISEHDDVYGVGIYNPTPDRTRPTAPAIACYINGQAIIP